MRGSAVRRAVSTIALAIVGVVLFGTPVGAVVDDPDLDSSGDYRYDVDTADGVVRVTIDLVVTADKPDQTVDDGVYQYYFNGFNLLVPAAAESLAVTDGSGVALDVDTEPVDDYTDLLAINFRRNLFYRQSTRITVSYVLVAGDADSDSIVRVNPASVSFAAWTSPNLEAATVSVELPADFVDQSLTDVPFTVRPEDTGRALYADGIDPEDYYALVSLTNDDELIVERLEVADVIDDPQDLDGSGAIVVRYWPGDESWRDHVLEGVGDGLPAMIELIGRPWPIEEELVITESFAPVLYGYAGWYDSRTETIEVTDVPDDHVLYHELTHIWFNNNMFTDRWINEGLAELFAAETERAVTGNRPTPPPIDEANPLIALSTFDGPLTEREELFGYRASWHVMERFAAEIGVEGLARIIEAADNRALSYTGDDVGEADGVATGAIDWRRFLDLAENVDGSNDGRLTQLVRDWVLGAPEAARLSDTLDQRRQSRDRYARLEEAGDEWAPPVGVRRTLTHWGFDRADQQMTAAEEALDRRADLVRTVSPAGADLPSDLETLYEKSDDDFDDLDNALADTEQAADELREAHDAIEADRSILQRIGLLGTDLDRERSEAAEAFGDGRLKTAAAESNEIDELIDDATVNGAIRSATAVLALLVLAAIVWFIVRRRRRRRRGRSGGPPAPIAAPMESWPPPPWPPPGTTVAS